MHKQRIAIFIIALVGFIAVFLPWISMPLVGSVNGAHGWGWLLAVLFAIPALLALAMDKSQPLEGRMLLAAVVPALICALKGIITLIRFKSSMSDDDPFSQLFPSIVSIGIGLILVIAAGIGVAVAAYALKGPAKTE